MFYQKTKKQDLKLIFVLYTIFFFGAFGVLKILAAPDTPTNLTPTDSATGVSTTPTLTSSVYSNGEDNMTLSGGVVDRINSDNFTGQNTEEVDNQTSIVSGGVSSNAPHLDGSDEFFKNEDPSFWTDTSSGGRSLSMWVRFDTRANAQLFRNQDNSSSKYSGFWGFRTIVSGPNYYLRLQRRVENGATFSPANIVYGTTNMLANTWYMVSITTNGSGHIMYVNSTQQGSRDSAANGDWWGDVGTGAGGLTSQFGIGAVPTNTNTAIDGYIDEVTYWNKELSSSEISELYNSGTPIDPTTHSASANLDGYWPLGEELEHAASQWQISDTSGDFSSPVYDSGTDTTNLTSITVPGGSALSEGTTYYWRVRHQDEEGDWSSWSTETSFTTVSAGTLSVDIVDSGGTTVGSPSVAMDPVTFSFSEQTATGTFGVSDEKIRVENSTGTATWNLSLAASATTDVWDSAGTDYDFNDPTASAGDGGDADSVGGQMTIDPSGTTITPEGGCTLTNISAGSSDAFEEGVTDSVTIASAASGADTGCYWDITGVDISQTIPAGQPAASDYNIDMVLSVVAS